MMNRAFVVIATALLASFGAACGETPVAPLPSPPVPLASTAGSIKVWVETTGGDIDQDGYEVVVGSAQAILVGASGPVTFAAPAGTHTVTLRHVAENCIVSGQRSVSVIVPTGGVVETTFTISCEATGIEITTSTTGLDSPGEYRVLINAAPAGVVGPTSTFRVTRLPPGTHTVQLVVPSHCVADSPQIFVAVANRAITPVTVRIHCQAAPPAQGKIAFVGWASGSHRILVINADGMGPVNEVVADGFDPAWSPDGNRIAYSNYDCDFYCTGGIAIINMTTRAITQLAAAAGGTDPAWSPTGDAIVFTAGQNAQLYLLRLDGTPAQHFNPSGIHSSSQATWSPDGQRIAFRCNVTAGDSDICVINRDGTGLLRFIRPATEDYSPAWSPDGSTIAFTRVDDYTEIAVMNADGTDGRRVRDGLEPAWSPDGFRLVFTYGDGLQTVRLDGSDVRRITVGNHRTPAWQP